METNLIYLLDSGNILNMFEILRNISERRAFRFRNTLLNIGPILHCSIGNNIFFPLISSLKLVY